VFIICRRSFTKTFTRYWILSKHGFQLVAVASLKEEEEEEEEVLFGITYHRVPKPGELR
jgi:hypothetical protein